MRSTVADQLYRFLKEIQELHGVRMRVDQVLDAIHIYEDHTTETTINDVKQRWIHYAGILEHYQIYEMNPPVFDSTIVEIDGALWFVHTYAL